MPHTLRFVDAITASPTTALDLNDGSLWLATREGTDFTPPALRYTESSSQLVDGDTVTSSVYENRTLTLALELNASSANAAATQLQALHRELDKPNNLLQYKPESATSPVFFRTIRADVPRLYEDYGNGGQWQGTIRIPAEPFAIGLKQTLTPNTISGTLPSYAEFDFSGISGDVPTPLLIGLSGTSVQDSIVAIGVRRRGTPSAATFLDPITGSASISSTSGTTVASFSWPDTANVDHVGDYRVYVEGSKSVATTPIALFVSHAAGTSEECVLGTTETGTRWYDAGVVSIPVGSAGRRDGYGAAYPGRPATFTIQARRLSAGSNPTFAVNRVYLVPADTEHAVVQFPDVSGTYYLDGPNDCEYVVSSGGLASSDPFSRSGRLPMLSPGAQATKLVVLNGLQGQSAAGSSTGNLTFAYWPRYRHVRPASS